MKVYAPRIGVSLPLDDESIYRVYQNFYGQETSYAMEAEEMKKREEDWEPIEEIANMFANAADELSGYDDGDSPDYALLSRMVEETAVDPEKDYPEYRQWYTENGEPTDFGS